MPEDEPHLCEGLIFGHGREEISGPCSIRLRAAISEADVWMFDNEIDWVNTRLSKALIRE